MRTIFLLALAMLGVAQLLALGQAPACTTYATGASSNAWMQRVQQLSLPEQVAAVRARAQCDTGLRHPTQYLCLMPLSATQREAYLRAQQPRARAEANRPAGVLLLYVVGNYTLTDNHPAHVKDFLQQVAATRIRRIVYLPAGASAAASHSTRGANGMVRLEAAPTSAPTAA